MSAYTPSARPCLPQWLETADHLLKTKFLPLGLFVQLTGMLWIGSSGYHTQTYLWCLFPGLLSLGIDFYRYGLRSCLHGMTTGEKLLAVLFLWILINPLFVSGGVSIETVFNRVLKIGLYLYVVRTVFLHNKRPEKLLLIAAGVATLFAIATMVYQFGILDRPIGIRALGESGYRVGTHGIGEFADLGNSILAALYYGCFASILCGYIAAKPFQWQRRILAIIAVIILGIFILLSGSRGPLMAFIAMGGMALLVCQYSWKKSVIVVLGVIGGVAALLLREEIFLQLDRVIADGFNGRFVNWAIAIEYIKKQPIFGYGAYAEYIGPLWRGVILGHPHNMLLNISYYWGIPAGLLFIAISIWSLWTSLAHRKQLLISIAGCALVFGQVGMITDTYSFLVRPDLQWLMFFFPVALLSASKTTEYKK